MLWDMYSAADPLVRAAEVLSPSMSPNVHRGKGLDYRSGEQVRLQRAVYLLKLQEDGERLMHSVTRRKSLQEEQAKIRDEKSILMSPSAQQRKRALDSPLATSRSTAALTRSMVDYGSEEAKKAQAIEARKRALERTRQLKAQEEAQLSHLQEAYERELERRIAVQVEHAERVSVQQSRRRRARRGQSVSSAASDSAGASTPVAEKPRRTAEQVEQFDKQLQGRYSEIMRRMRAERDQQATAAKERAERLRKARERMPAPQPAPERKQEPDRTHAEALRRVEEERRYIRCVVIVQSLWRMRVARRDYVHMMQGRSRQRAAIAKELLETEQKYVTDLENVVELFLKPLRERHILSDADIRVVFGNLEEILPVNKLIRDDLRKIIGNWTVTSRIGECLKMTAPYLKIYAPYCRNYQNALQLLGRLRGNRDFVSVMNDAERSPLCNGLTLVSFLIMPIQRIPRYELLLKELIKHTSRDHPDYTGLTEALTLIKTAAAFVNEEIRSSERMWKVMEIQQRLTGKFETLVQPSRRFVREGQLMEKHRKQARSRHFFLFNDALLCAAKNTLAFAFGEFEFKYLIDLSTISTVSNNVEDPDLPFAFKLDLSDGSEIVLGAETTELRHEWVREILSQKESAKRRIRHSGLSGLST